MLDRVQAVPDVRVAVPVIEAVVSTGLKGQGNLLILGVDMTGDRSLRDYDLKGERRRRSSTIRWYFSPQPDSLIVTDTFARENQSRHRKQSPHEHHGGRKAVSPFAAS